APNLTPALSLLYGAGEGDRFGAIREIGPSFFHWIKSLEFGEPFLRSAINPCGGILFAQTLEGRNRFVGLAAAKTVGLPELTFAHGQRAGHDASGFLLREVNGHLGEHGRVRVGQDAERFGVPLAEQPGTHVTLPVQRVTALTLAMRVQVGDRQTVRAFGSGDNFALRPTNP